MVLTRSQLEHFVSDGFIVIPKLISREQSEGLAIRVNREFNLWREKSFPVETETGGIFGPQWSESADIMKTIQGRGVLAALFDCEVTWFDHLIVLDPQDDDSWPIGRLHVDRPPTTDSSRQWPSFSLNIGVAIQNGNTKNSGGLGVFPQSHRQYESYFKIHKDKTLWDGLDADDRHPITNRPRVELPKVTLKPLQEVLLEPGDVVLMHSMLAHTSMPNCTSERRIAQYFRVIHPAHKSYGNEYIRSIWSYWHKQLRSFSEILEH